MAKRKQRAIFPERPDERVLYTIEKPEHNVRWVLKERRHAALRREDWGIEVGARLERFFTVEAIHGTQPEELPLEGFPSRDELESLGMESHTLFHDLFARSPRIPVSRWHIISQYVRMFHLSSSNENDSFFSIWPHSPIPSETLEKIEEVAREFDNKIQLPIWRVRTSNKQHPLYLVFHVCSVLQEIEKEVKMGYLNTQDMARLHWEMKKRHRDAGINIRFEEGVPPRRVHIELKGTVVPIEFPKCNAWVLRYSAVRYGSLIECMRLAYLCGRLVEQILSLADCGQHLLEGQRWAQLRHRPRDREASGSEGILRMRELIERRGFGVSKAARKVASEFGGKAEKWRRRWYRFRNRG